MNEFSAPTPEHPMHPSPSGAERPKKLSEAVVTSLRAEFRALVDGDLDDNLLQIEHLASRTRELFLTLKGGEQHMYARRSPYSANVASYSSPMVWNGSGAVGGQNVEQFGAVAIRQIVENVPEVASRIAEAITNSPARQVDAIATARREGLVDLADRLEKRLLASSPAAEAPADDDDGHPALGAAGSTNGVTTNGATTNGVQTNGGAHVGAEG